MNRVGLANLAALALAVALTVALAWPRHRTPVPAPLSRAEPAKQVKRARLATGEVAIADATGRLVAIRPYQRVVSTNLVTDHLLVDLCERERIRAVSSAAARRKRDGYRYHGLSTVDGFGRVEAIVALGPDLVLTNSFGAPGVAERLREAGVEVFDLGELRGEDSFKAVALSLGELLAVPERAGRLVRSFESRLHNVSARLPAGKSRRALFLSVLGPDLQGGTVGTSYHDILEAAGLVDVAAASYRDWPAYSAEQVLALAPDLVVTRKGLVASVCSYPGMSRLPACLEPGHMVEIDGELLDEPGLAMLDAAEDLFSAVH